MHAYFLYAALFNKNQYTAIKAFSTLNTKTASLSYLCSTIARANLSNPVRYTSLKQQHLYDNLLPSAG